MKAARSHRSRRVNDVSQGLNMNSTGASRASHKVVGSIITADAPLITNQACPCFPKCCTCPRRQSTVAGPTVPFGPFPVWRSGGLVPRDRQYSTVAVGLRWSNRINTFFNFRFNFPDNVFTREPLVNRLCHGGNADMVSLTNKNMTTNFYLHSHNWLTVPTNFFFPTDLHDLSMTIPLSSSSLAPSTQESFNGCFSLYASSFSANRGRSMEKGTAKILNLSRAPSLLFALSFPPNLAWNWLSFQSPFSKNLESEGQRRREMGERLRR